MSAGEFGLGRAGRVPRADRAPGGHGRCRSSGHSMGAIGAILAGAAEPRVAAVVATSAPADPYRLTRQTFRLAHLPIPDPIAYPLAWLTTRVYLRPRGHVVARRQRVGRDRPLPRPDPAGPRRRGPGRAARAPGPTRPRRPRRSRRGSGRRPGRDPRDRAVASTRGCTRTPRTAPPSRGSWRRALGGPLAPDEAAAIAPRPPPAERIPDAEPRFAAVESEPRRLPDARPGRAAGRDAAARPATPASRRPRPWPTEPADAG